MSIKNIVVGVLAHVDSGKTTLSEAMLYINGNIRKLGRVDHGDTVLDNFYLERKRGITIFSKQAVIKDGDTTIYLIDTPGHVDFSAEMERALSVLDYAIFLIDGSSEMKSHTLTLWELLRRYNIPTFIFVNKMDMSYRTEDEILNELKGKLSGNIMKFADNEEFYEELSLTSEKLLEKHLSGNKIDECDVINAVKNREAFLCVFGSALKLEGIDKLMQLLMRYTATDSDLADNNMTAANSDLADNNMTVANSIGAIVYKISRDESGNRLTHLKITSGTLKVKDEICDNEKVNQIRVYIGNKYELVKEATKGMLVAVTGLSETVAGQRLGSEAINISFGENNMNETVLMPVLNYTLETKDCDSVKLFNTISELSEEDATLQISLNEVTKLVEIKLMGPIQVEVLKEIIKERFGLEVEFGKGDIIYKETIEDEVIGIGHFEPLRHYAEVHLRIRSGKRGSGIVARLAVRTDELDKNWQRLILTHIKEKKHKGVLTGSALTDVEIEIVAGRAHKKHTEGGDFRQATYRAIRQGLMKAESVLLEPVYEFSLQLQRELVGRAMTDIEKMSGRCESPEILDEMAIIRGYCPVATMMDYAMEVMAYSKGRGVLNTRVAGYEKCHNSDEIIANKSYNPLADIRNTPDSVFCAGGAGMTIAYNRVEEFMHIPMDYLRKNDEDNFSDIADNISIGNASNHSGKYNGSQERNRETDIAVLDKELMAIFEKTYGPVKRKTPVGNGYNGKSFIGESNNNGKSKVTENIKDSDKKYQKRPEKIREQYLLVDGYNVIFADEKLSDLARENLDGARYKLMDMLSNYKGVKNDKIMVVFDAYRIKGNVGSLSEYNNITVVFTKEAETADAYIERFAHDNAKKYDITVATSDGLEQIIILGEGSKLKSSRELLKDMKEAVEIEVRSFDERKESGKVYMQEVIEERNL